MGCVSLVEDAKKYLDPYSSLVQSMVRIVCLGTSNERRSNYTDCTTMTNCMDRGKPCVVGRVLNEALDALVQAYCSVICHDEAT